MRLSVWMVGVSVTLAVTGCAGRVPTTFTDLGKRVPAGTTVYVTTTDGTKVKGALTTVSVSSMTVSLRDTSTRQFSEADVMRIRVRDPLWNGLLVGAGIGGFLGYSYNDTDCLFSYTVPDCKKGSPAQPMAIGAAIGAAIGTGIDALRLRRVFRGTKATTVTHGPSVFFGPVVTPDLVAVRVSSRF